MEMKKEIGVDSLLLTEGASVFPVGQDCNKMNDNVFVFGIGIASLCVTRGKRSILFLNCFNYLFQFEWLLSPACLPYTYSSPLPTSGSSVHHDVQRWTPEWGPDHNRVPGNAVEPEAPGNQDEIRWKDPGAPSDAGMAEREITAAATSAIWKIKVARRMLNSLFACMRICLHVQMSENSDFWTDKWWAGLRGQEIISLTIRCTSLVGFLLLLFTIFYYLYGGVNYYLERW